MQNECKVTVTANVAEALGKECRVWCDGRARMQIKELIISNALVDDAVICSDGFFMQGRISVSRFSTRIKGKIIAEQISCV